MRVETWEVSNNEYPTKVVEAMKEIGIELTNVQATIPFPQMKATDERVWSNYCPTQEKLKDITVPLPMQVVELIKTYQSTFHEFQIWSESRDQVDPILIGVAKKDKEDLKYLICRWGESLKPFSEIREMVIKQWKERRRINIEKKLRDIDSDAQDYFGGQWVNDWLH
jgi:hypothetical protein